MRKQGEVSFLPPGAKCRWGDGLQGQRLSWGLEMAQNPPSLPTFCLTAQPETRGQSYLRDKEGLRYL